MIEVTATMLPSTVMNDRSLADQMASSAISDASKSLFISGSGGALPALLHIIHLHQIAVGHAPHRVVRAGDHLVAALEAAQHLEVLVAGNAHLDREEFRAAVAHQEHALHFLPRLPGLELR